ncbi:MAG: SGNH/GDSL hydrolase family protein [Kiritimatiellae bacterium]|nr:SGNH/GDSL hydrolase family protein [Kiritimatiellia bacterium]
MRRGVTVWLKRCAIGLGGLLAALIISEFAVRFFAPHNIIPCPYDIDPRIGPRFRPNTQWMQLGATGEVRAVVKLNSRGLRCPEFDGRPRIMLIGDSFTWGAGVTQEKIFSSRLQSRLPKYQFVNYAMWAHAPAEYWAIYHFFKHEAKPVRVIVGFFEGNDFAARSAIVQKTGNRYVFVPYQPKSKWFASFRRFVDGRILWFLERRSQLFNWLKDAMYLRIFPPTPPQRSMDFAFDMLKGLADEARSDGVPVTVVIIPSPPGYAESFFPDQQFYTDGLIARLKAEQIAVVDLRTAMTERHRFFYSRDDRHFNEEGHRLTAEIICREVFADECPACD